MYRSESYTTYLEGKDGKKLNLVFSPVEHGA